MNIPLDIVDTPAAGDDIGRPIHVGCFEANAPPAAIDAPAHGFESQPAGQRSAILVVDDEATVRLLITEVLDDLNYASLEAVDGPSGLLILQSDAAIELMITDVGLPGGMNGRHLASAARIARPGLAILFITGYAETAAIGDGGLEPRTMVLTKPFSIDALTSKITELMSDQPSRPTV